MPPGPWSSTSTRRPSGTSSTSARRRPWPGSSSPSSWSSRYCSSGFSAATPSTERGPAHASLARAIAVPTSSPRARVDWQRIVLTGALVVLAVVWLLPVVWVVVTSLKPTENIVRLPPEWVPWPATGAHYHGVLLSSSRTGGLRRAFLRREVI